MVGAIEQVSPRGTLRFRGQLHLLLTEGTAGSRVFDFGLKLHEISGLCWPRGWLQAKLFAQCDEGGAFATAVAAIATRLGKTLGQDVQRPTAGEFHSAERYRNLLL